MNCHYHPDPETLTRYAAGDLSPAFSIAVKLHSHFCSGCATSVNELESLGGYALENQKNTSVEICFDTLMEKIKAICTLTNTPALSQDLKQEICPKSMQGILLRCKSCPTLTPWKRITSSLAIYPLDIDDPIYNSSLYKLKPGARSARHTHKGKEITVVLKGSFEDEFGEYNTGDYIVLNSSNTHTPIATSECICFALLDEPLHFTGLFGPIINMIAART